MSTLIIESIEVHRGKKTLIQDSSLTIQSGDIIAILGKNGCGKSTFFHSIFGTQKVSKLLWKFDGKPLGKPSTKNGIIALLPQESFMPRNLSPSELIALMYKTDEKQKPLFSVPYISDYALKNMSELSHGTARFVEIVIILHLWHPFIILDEPFSLLAPLHKDIIKNLILEKSKTKGIVIADHSYQELMDLSTKIISIEDKKLITMQK